MSDLSKDTIKLIGVFVAAAPFYLDFVSASELLSTVSFAAGLLMIIFADKVQTHLRGGKK